MQGGAHGAAFRRCATLRAAPTVSAMDLALIAGAVSTMIFAAATLPMITKAVRTRDLASYSLPSLALSNAGNLVHTVYVLSLPPGPVWALHGFYVVSMGIMIALRLTTRRDRGSERDQTRGSAHPGGGRRR